MVKLHKKVKLLMQALQDQQKYKANFVFACFPTKQGFKQPLQWQGAKIRNSTYSGTYSYLEIRTFPSIKINCVHFQEQKQFDCSISPLNLLIINQKRNLTKTFHNCSRQCYCYIFSGTQERKRKKLQKAQKSERCKCASLHQTKQAFHTWVIQKQP